MNATVNYRLALFLTLAAMLTAVVILAVMWAGAGPAGAQGEKEPPAKPSGFRVVTERGSLEVALDWADVGGASRYWVRWRESGQGNQLNEGVYVQSSDAVISVARYGEWVVRVQACDDSGCGAPNARKFRVRRPRAMPDITPLPTATTIPEATVAPTPLPTATPTPEPTTAPTPPPGTLQVSVTASSDTLPVNQSVSLTTAVSNPPAGSEPSYVWELSNGGDWFSHGTGSTLSYLAGRAESWSFRVTVTYGSGDSATSGPLTVTWVDITSTPTATPAPLTTATPTPDPTSTPTPDPIATPTPDPSVPIPEEPTGLSISATPGSPDVSVDWDDAPGASYYWVRWRMSGPGNPLNEGVVVLPSVVVITVGGYGEWVARVQACNDAGCGPPVVSKFSVESEPTATSTPEPLGQPENLEVSAQPGELDVLATWDTVEDATSYHLRWRKSGGEFDAANAVSASNAIWAVVVSDYGRWEVRVQACNDAGCGPEASSSAEVVKAASLSLERSASRTISATWEPVEDAAAYTLSWLRISLDSPAPTNDTTTARQARSVSGSSGDGGQGSSTQTSDQLTVPADRTGADLTVPDGGAYRVELEAVDDGNELIAMAHNHVDQADDHPDTTPPWPEWGKIDRDEITLYFSEPMDEDAVNGYFQLFGHFQVGDRYPNGLTAYGIKVSGNKVTAHLGGAQAREGLPVRVTTYHKSRNRIPPSVKSLRDLAGNPMSMRRLRLHNLTGPPRVSGEAISSDAGADRIYVGGETIQVKLTFSEAVNVSGTPRVRIDLDPADGGEKWADYYTGSGENTLEFAYRVVGTDLSTSGVALLENTLELNGGAIRSASAVSEENAKLAHDGLKHNPDHRVVTPDNAPPILQSASVTGATLTLTFSEPLGAAASLATSAFTVKKTPQGGTEQEVSLSGSPAISSTTLTLTLASAALETDTGLKVSYAKPAAGTNNRLVDPTGSEVANFTDEWVTNTRDTTKPTLVRGEIDGDVVTLYFSEPLNEHSVGGRVQMKVRGIYCVGSDKCGETCTLSFTARGKMQVSGNKVVVDFSKAQWTQRARVGIFVQARYEHPFDPAADRLKDIAGNPVSTHY
ncbi:MAG: hypothetical protein F4X94_01025, partial [Dehalococcoidia bacterium]|nr:hypothetical protein [Dehalococcoidia bacterium]